MCVSVKEKKQLGDRMPDPTKTHNSMIYLFMDIKMHVSLRSVCEIVVKNKCEGEKSKSTLHCTAIFNVFFTFAMKVKSA